MRISLKRRILLPVVFVLVILPVTIWTIFSITSKRYVQARAQEELDSLLLGTEIIMDELYKNVTEEQSQDWRGLSKELLQQTKAYVRKHDGAADLLIFSSNEVMIYPKEENKVAEITELSEYCLKQINKNKAESKQLPDELITSGKKMYLIKFSEVVGEGYMRAKYMISYVPVQDHYELLSMAGRLVFVIVGGIAVLAIIFVWRLSDHIGGEIQVLCGYAERIGGSEFYPPEQQFTIAELEFLHHSLKHMELRLKQSEEMQKTFFQNVSHELRTPLMSICGYAQGIEKGILQDNKRAAAIIAAESLRLKELVDGILTISELDNRTIILYPCHICLNDFIEETVEQMGGMQTIQGKRIRLSFPKKVIYIDTEPELLKKCLVNVISNCIRYATNEVQISLYQEQNLVELVIEDDGNGFQQEDLAHVFERFYKGKNGKFGIGLSIAKSSIEYLGGQIIAENGNMGARFVIHIGLTFQKL